MWVRLWCAGTSDQHIIAVPDKGVGHRVCEDRSCPCNPRIEPTLENDGALVLHRSSDGREYIDDAEALVRAANDPEIQKYYKEEADE